MTSSPYSTPRSYEARAERFNPPSAREAFRLARELERARPQHQSGHRLYWITSGSFGSCDLAASVAAAVVVGSHDLCDVRLADPRIELRHLLIRTTMVDDGCALLSVLDLHTAHGFYLSNGSVERSIDATGAVVIRVGGYAIVALPSGRKLPDELPLSIVEPATESPYRGAMFSPELLARPLDGSSRITQLPGIVDAIEAASSVRANEGELYEITMRSAAGTRSVRITGTALRRGVLVGRSLNCNTDFRMMIDMGISRGHLLFLKDRHGEMAYDLSSTQGSYSFGRRERAVKLDDGGTTVMIGAAQKISLSWRRVN
ncbi:MAG: hypothetical protein ABI461_04645 [Polyangiaceae bacterium]